MPVAEAFGYLASGLVLATFTMRTMIPLRFLGISSNVAFIAYGSLAGIYPVLILHAILLPLNVYRLAEMYRLIRKIDDAADESEHVRSMMPFMSPLSLSTGSRLFARGEPATNLYFLSEGRVRLEEFDVEVGPGNLIGEIGIFAPNGVRTATVTCLEDCQFQRMSRDRVRELVFQNPGFALHLIGLVADRMTEDLAAVERHIASGAQRA